MGIFNVTQKEFDNIIKRSLKLYGCPKCCGSVDVIMELPTFGAYKVGFKCNHCGYEVKDYCRSSHITDKKRFGTPVTPLSLAKSLFNAAELWNRKRQECMQRTKL